MKQIEIKDMEFGKHYATAKLMGNSWSPTTIKKMIDHRNKIVFKEVSHQNTVSLHKLYISKIGYDRSNEIIYALNYFNSIEDALKWCIFENRLRKDDNFNDNL